MHSEIKERKPCCDVLLDEREEDMQLRLRRLELVLLCFMFAFERTEGMVSVIGGPRKGPSGACG